MKAVFIGQPSGATMEEIMAVYPRHKAIVEKYMARGVVIGIGPFSDRGNMAIFSNRSEAEAFALEDPFVLEGLVASYVIRDWHDTLLGTNEP
ncbi:MAG: YciI family protein [Marinilabiliales bacterium]|nr:YciI family protein [Marinilabiliales bacterium]